jgi:hypothetical protein
LRIALPIEVRHILKVLRWESTGCTQALNTRAHNSQLDIRATALGKAVAVEHIRRISVRVQPPSVHGLRGRNNPLKHPPAHFLLDLKGRNAVDSLEMLTVKVTRGMNTINRIRAGLGLGGLNLKIFEDVYLLVGWETDQLET